MARKDTVAAFEKWIEDEENVFLVLDMIAGGKTLRATAFELKRPPTCMYDYFHATPERLARLDAACKSGADAAMDETREIADTVKPSRDDVAKAKLQIEQRHIQAKAYNRDRWGETLKVEKEVVVVDANLLADMGELLRLTAPKTGRVIEQDEALTLPSPEEAA